MQVGHVRDGHIIRSLLLVVQGSQFGLGDEGANAPAAIQSQVRRKLADLQCQVAQAAAKTSEAKQKRRALLADISSCASEHKSSCAPYVVQICSPPIEASSLRGLLKHPQCHHDVADCILPIARQV